MVVVALIVFVSARTALTAAESAEKEPAPPEGQTYTGVKRCAACHFDQFMAWKKDKHSKTFELLPANYQEDAKCLKCHTTGYGEETGFKTAADKNLAGTTCESCHGPGSEHEKVSLKFGKAKLNAEQEKEVRDSIWKTLPENVCVKCHTTKGHHPSETPKELRKQ
jgi:hypothetical protein